MLFFLPTKLSGCARYVVTWSAYSMSNSWSVSMCSFTKAIGTRIKFLWPRFTNAANKKKTQDRLATGFMKMVSDYPNGLCLIITIQCPAHEALRQFAKINNYWCKGIRLPLFYANTSYWTCDIITQYLFIFVFMVYFSVLGD